MSGWVRLLNNPPAVMALPPMSMSPNEGRIWPAPREPTLVIPVWLMTTSPLGVMDSGASAVTST
jgi:hypothetical protein